MIIVYQNSLGRLIVLHPAELPKGVTLLDVAKKYVPKGVKFLITDPKLLPQDRVFRDAWSGEGLVFNSGVGEKDD
jgi:hypothetical protein